MRQETGSEGDYLEHVERLADSTEEAKTAKGGGVRGVLASVGSD
jgi:hypothetical protein